MSNFEQEIIKYWENKKKFIENNKIIFSFDVDLKELGKCVILPDAVAWFYRKISPFPNENPKEIVEYLQKMTPDNIFDDAMECKIQVNNFSDRLNFNGGYYILETDFPFMIKTINTIICCDDIPCNYYIDKNISESVYLNTNLPTELCDIIGIYACRQKFYIFLLQDSLLMENFSGIIHSISFVSRKHYRTIYSNQ